jgi:hypothetical protein
MTIYSKRYSVARRCTAVAVQTMKRYNDPANQRIQTSCVLLTTLPEPLSKSFECEQTLGGGIFTYVY